MPATQLLSWQTLHTATLFTLFAALFDKHSNLIPVRSRLRCAFFCFGELVGHVASDSELHYILESLQINFL